MIKDIGELPNPARNRGFVRRKQMPLLVLKSYKKVNFRATWG
jgi:hypothetical protein